MKKMLLTAALTSVALSLGAAVPSPASAPRTLSQTALSAARAAASGNPITARAARVDEENTSTATDYDPVTMLVGHDEGPYSAIGYTPINGALQGGAIKITSDFIKTYEGCTITAIGLCNGMSSSDATGATLAVTAFVADSLAATPSQTVSGTMNIDDAGSFMDLTLSEPITITADMQPFFVGFTCKTSSTIYPLVIDGDTSNDRTGYGCFIGLAKNSSSAMSWTDYASGVGALCVRVRLTGGNFPVNQAQMTSFYYPTTVYAGEDETAYVQFTNHGARLDNVGINLTIAGEEQQTVTLPIARRMEYLESAIVSLPAQFKEAVMNGQLSVALVEVDGKTNEYAAGQTTMYATVLDPSRQYYQKNVLVEEATGTWCGYCPRGYNVMEELKNKYTDGSCITVAVHSGDAMTASSYGSYLSKYISGFPAGTVNRNIAEYGTMGWTDNDAEEAYLEELQVPATAEIEIEDVTVSGAKVNVKVRARQAYDGASTYRISFALVEDNVGPYNQTNYYSDSLGSQDAGDLEGWNDKDYTASGIYFNDVARFNSSFAGYVNSIPSKDNVADEWVEFEKSFACSTVKKKEDARLVAIVVNSLTGRVENVVAAPMISTAGINSVAVDAAEGPVSYFNLQGMPVAQPRSGQVVIRRSQAGSQKVVY
jgi:thiol-disulfide isomerase/thioredoxin